MKLKKFLKTYGGGACISLKGYCEEEKYDYFTMPKDYYGNPDEDALLESNVNHYKPSCMAKEPWWNEVKNREIKRWIMLDAEQRKDAELIIELEEQLEI